ncbi:OmpA family protein [Lipingzhangella sp. LS1_29]|uniref:OmpA family protein n=1 Tax=Lipingzhangella rawalii TaxID=2055835 RepID=A0ABU2H5U8_9ACTN|nr:OmpA family protein [Lipingzhangella rawalii]MDS1270682.1 OmpA family protein [Lipingzhangella rawalii]
MPPLSLPLPPIVAGGLVIATAGCGLFSGDDDIEGPPPEPDDVQFGSSEEFVREVNLFHSADNVPAEVAVEAVEATYESTALYLSLTNPEQTRSSSDMNVDLTQPFLFDPISGRGYLGNEDAGSADVNTSNVDFFADVTNVLRFYYPPLPQDVEYVTFFGIGVGAMSGIPVERVQERRPEPEPGIEGDEAADRNPDPGETLVWPAPELDHDAEHRIFDTEGFVEGEGASLTRDGDEETIALSADVLFDFDDADLTDEAADLISDTAESIDQHSTEAGTLMVTGHTDGVGDDDYNDTLSEERAEAVADELESLLSADLDVHVEGLGSSDPLVEEEGEDDEEARERNRRVELTYAATAVSSSDTAQDSGIAAAERHVADPASYRADLGESVETLQHEGFQLDVYPLLRDGAHVLAEVEMTNTTEGVAQPELESSRTGAGGSGEQLDAFRLHEQESDLMRYPLVMRTADGQEELFAETPRDFDPGESHRLAVVFPAPAPDTSEVTLDAGPFGEAPVPIE